MKRFKSAEHALRFIETPDQEEPPGIEIAGMCGVRPIAMRFERRPRGAKPLHGSTEIARDELDRQRLIASYFGRAHAS